MILFQESFAAQRHDSLQKSRLKFRFDLAVSWEHELVEVVGGVVAGLQAVNHGASLQGDSALEFLGIGVGVNSFHRHVHDEFYFVVFLPFSLNDEIAFNHGGVEFLSVHEEVVLAAPVGVAQRYFEFALLFGVHADCDLPVPGIVGFLPDLDIIVFQRNGRLASYEEIEVNGIFFLGVDVAAYRGDEARLVRGAAGAAEPFSSVEVGVLVPFAHVVPGLAGLGVEGQKLVVVEEGSAV